LARGQGLGVPTGGAMPKGYLTEEGPRPEFADLMKGLAVYMRVVG
jgi:hypothetical protein